MVGVEGGELHVLYVSSKKNHNEYTQPTHTIHIHTKKTNAPSTRAHTSASHKHYTHNTRIQHPKNPVKVHLPSA